MFFACLRAAEFVLLSFLPSLISSFIFVSASNAITNIVSLLLFLILAVGIVVLGYRFMSATGNKDVYFRITGTAYVIFAAIALAILISMGEEGSLLLTNGLLVFDAFGIGAGFSVILSLILLFGCAVIPGYVFKKKTDFHTAILKNFYRDAAYRYRPSQRKEQTHKAEENKVQKPEKDDSPTAEELQKWAEYEKRRREYEKRFTMIKPAKFTKSKSEETEEEIIERKMLEKGARLQQYFIEESKKKEHPPVDKEAELKKAHELEQAMNESKYHSNYRRNSHHETKAVDKEAELKRARELKLQLEYEEVQRMEELFRKK